jgi:multicomponent Na+:H+ antiporter subunit D
LTLVKAGLEQNSYVIVIVALGVSLLTLFSMTKIWSMAFWGESSPLNLRQQPVSPFSEVALYMPVVMLAALTLGIGLLAEPLYAICLRAAGQLLNPADYINAVLGRAS